MSIKALFVDSNENYKESTAGVYELTEFKSSAGAGSESKPALLNASGYANDLLNLATINHNSLLNGGGNAHIDWTITGAEDVHDDRIPSSAVTQHVASIDHDSLLNFVANEHIDWTGASAGTIDPTNYPSAVLIDGSRDLTAVLEYDTNKTFTNDVALVSKKYVDDQVAALGTSAEWLNSVLDRYDPTTALPSTPSTGDRYLSTATANGWTVDYIYEWNGSTWDETIPSTGTYVSVDDEPDLLYYYGGSSWTAKSVAVTTASLGVKRVSDDFQLDYSSGKGLALSGNSAYVQAGDLVGEGLATTGSDPDKNIVIDWSTAFNDSKAVKASDLSSTSNGLGASIIGSEDAGGYYATGTVEGQLQEIGATLAVGVGGQEYTLSGTVAKGDPVYISANNTVTKYSDITVAEVVVGLAATGQTGGTLKVLANDQILTSVLGGSAVAGKKYFWSGTGWVSVTTGFSAGDHIWLGGVAKNGSDVAVEVAFVRVAG